MGFALLLMMLSALGIWVICLVQILSGNGLDNFQLGTVVTSATALGASYLIVFVGDTLFFLALIWCAIAHYRHIRDEQEFIAKYGKYRNTPNDRRLAWRKKLFPKKEKE